ncbi:hypothetical protein CYMTET_36175, partial [Cymbomonas tetramitiformis]
MLSQDDEEELLGRSEMAADHRAPSKTSVMVSEHMNKTLSVVVMLCVLLLPNMQAATAHNSGKAFLSSFHTYVSGDAAMTTPAQEQIDNFFTFYREGPEGVHALSLKIQNTTWWSNRTEPQRSWNKELLEYKTAGSHVVVSAEFDLTAARKEEAQWSLVMITCVVLMLLVSSAVLNAVVIETVIIPLERMFHLIAASAEHLIDKDEAAESMNTVGDEAQVRRAQPPDPFGMTWHACCSRRSAGSPCTASPGSPPRRSAPVTASYGRAV